MPLTDRQIKNLKAKGKPYKISDGGGLHLLIKPNGSKLWRLKYRFEGKEKLLSFGLYPDTTLQKARLKREEAKSELKNGFNPGDRQKISNSKLNLFEDLALDWWEKQKNIWTEGHAERVRRNLERDIFPVLGSKSFSSIKAQEILSLLRKVEARGALETAHRELGYFNQIFKYGVACGLLERDPASDLKGALTPTTEKHLASQTEPEKVGQLLRAIDSYEGSFVVKSALKLAPLVFVRPGELRTAKWSDINLSEKEWRFITSKTETAHIVPLSNQAVKILKDLEPFTNKSEFTFPTPRSNKRPLSDNALLSAFRRMGITKEEMSVHGFRAMARTMLDERLKFRPDIIEHQLAHVVKDPNGRAYNRTAHLEERVEMMQKWADYLDELKVHDKDLV